MGAKWSVITILEAIAAVVTKDITLRQMEEIALVNKLRYYSLQYILVSSLVESLRWIFRILSWREHGVSTWQINLVFVMCSRHHRRTRDLFVMCSRHQSYLPLFVMFVWAFTTDFGNGVYSVCSLNCGFASVSAEQIEQILEDKDSENTKKKYKSSEACILGIKNIRLTWGLSPVLIFIYMADFSCKMNNKRIIEFGPRLRQITLTSVWIIPISCSASSNNS